MVQECPICKEKKNSFMNVGVCLDCISALPSSRKQHKEEGQPSKVEVLKVKCFYGSLITIQDQMNKFFELEGIGRDRLVDIKYEKPDDKGWNDNNSVMVLYV
jgi:hypothetical protein